MSIVVRYAPVPTSTLEQYDEVMSRLRESGELPADGFDYHVAFLSDGQLLVTEVWDSQEQMEAFGKRVMPLLADVALEHSGRPEILQVHNIIKRLRQPFSPIPFWTDGPVRSGSTSSPAFASIVLTFLAGMEVDPAYMRRRLDASVAMGVSSFAGPLWSRRSLLSSCSTGR